MTVKIAVFSGVFFERGSREDLSLVEQFRRKNPIESRRYRVAEQLAVNLAEDSRRDRRQRPRRSRSRKRASVKSGACVIALNELSTSTEENSHSRDSVRRESDICVFECERGDFLLRRGNRSGAGTEAGRRANRRATKRTREGDAVSW